MHNSTLVSERKRIGNLTSNPNRLVKRKRTRSLQSLPERFAFHVRHHVEEMIARFARIVERQNVRVVKLRYCLDLSQKTVAGDGDSRIRL